MVVFRGTSGLLPPRSGGKIFPLKNGNVFVKMVVFGKKWGFAHTDFDFLNFILPPLDSVLNMPLKTPTPEYFSEKIYSYMQEIKSIKVKQQWKKVKAREAFHKIGKKCLLGFKIKVADIWSIFFEALKRGSFHYF